MINIVCALDCEAKPITKHFDLVRDNKSEVKLYKNSNINLIVSGIGNENCQSAINFLNKYDIKSSAWLNIGIAGHPTLGIGESGLANKINYENSGTCFYPPALNKKNIDTELYPIQTVENPEHEYKNDCVYDMESYFFYQAASKIQTSELIQCYKIISDNKLFPAKNINAKKVKELIGNKIPEIESIINELLNILNVLPVDRSTNCFNKLTNAHHFTQYQQHVLKKLLNKYYLLSSHEDPFSFIQNQPNSDKLLKWLENEIKNQPVRLSKYKH